MFFEGTHSNRERSAYTGLAPYHEGFDLLHLSLHLGVVGVVRGIELVVVVVDRR